MKTNSQLSTRTPPNYDLTLPPMSAADLDERRECEATIQNGMAVMEDMAEAATRLRDKMLYRNTHGTWEAYCAEHFGRSARRIQQICAGQGVIKEFEVMPNPPSVRPTNEKQVRPLVGLPPEERRGVWDEAVSQTPAGKPVSASTVRAVADRKKGAESAEEPEWPKPNKHGVYDEDDARVERLEFKHALATAEVVALQVRSGWISRCNYDHKCGNQVGNSGPLTVTLMHTTRESALTVALGDLRKEHLAVVNERGGHPKQKQVAKMIAEWCGTQLRELGGNRRDAKGAEKEAPAQVDLVKAHRESGEDDVMWLARQISETIDTMLGEIRGLPVPLATRFGQAIYFLGCARTELGRLARDPDNAKARSGETAKDAKIAERAHGFCFGGGIQRRAATTAKERLRRIARARWNKAKALGKELGKGKK